MSSQKHLHTVDLDSLVDPIAKVKINGKEHDVMPISGACYDLATKIEEAGKSLSAGQQLDYTRKLISELVPSLERAQIDRLGPKQIAAILDIATGPVNRAQARIEREERKNGDRSARRAKNGRSHR